MKMIHDFTVVRVTSSLCKGHSRSYLTLKTNLHMTTTEDRLQNLMLFYAEQDLVASVIVDTVIDKFETMVPFEQQFVL